ncbi:polysaccharide deacetylase family protein [Hathewaya massiliensis]|uniref:polysaccharide deacetylase family protein n=1 Tax=Hathewaya massiliensis TaxID=1964382 RepID=UPI00115C003D|nr:polysaccharide deacetylase family protein [Hathewaya massiliensis]
MIYLYIQNKNYINQISYVFETIFLNLGFDYKILDKTQNININTEDILISYLKDNESSYDLPEFKYNIKIKDSNGLFNSNSYMKETVFENIKVQKFDIHNYGEFISLFSKEDTIYLKRTYENHSLSYETNFDFISDSFFILTRMEEVVSALEEREDPHNRFSALQSLAYKNDFLDRPIVNEYVEFLWNIIDEFKLGYLRKNWWGNNKFSVCLTHDVDMVFKYTSFKKEIRNSARYLLKEKSPNKFLSNLGLFVKSKVNYSNDPYWNIKDIMDLEQKKGFTSSFYFMSGGTSKVDNYYKVYDERIKNLIRYVEENNFEAGYHASFNSYNDIDLMKEEKEILDKIIREKPYGCRQHYLRFQAPYTWRLQEAVKLNYDTTLGYADREGFRAGYCFPYKPYDLLENKIIDIWEIPLIVMDVTLAGSNYSNLKPKEGILRVKELMSTVENYGGVFTILWHNSSFDELNPLWRQWAYVYGEILEYIEKKPCSVASGRGIIRNIESVKKRVYEYEEVIAKTF